jgi:hydroxypyruvate isomerase
MGIDAVADVALYGELIGHAQYAEAPGRRAPGTGRGNAWAFAEALAGAGYDGPIGLEFESVGPTADALGVLSRMRPRAEELR